jgi:hypothetical protein
MPACPARMGHAPEELSAFHPAKCPPSPALLRPPRLSK